MDNNRLIKSNVRVKEHGEVFTPNQVVELMLDQPEIKSVISDLESTFLEPSAGEGAFLTALLRRKMTVAYQLSESIKEYDINVLLGLMSLYGVELLEDNVEQLVMNMIVTFINEYAQVSSERFKSEINADVIESAKTVIRTNMVQGNAITKLNDKGDPLIFSEWKRVGRTQVKRTEYTFEAILNGGSPLETVVAEKEPAEFDLFTGWFEDELEDDLDVFKEPELLRYKVVKVTKVFEERLEEVED